MYLFRSVVSKQILRLPFGFFTMTQLLSQGVGVLQSSFVIIPAFSINFSSCLKLSFRATGTLQASFCTGSASSDRTMLTSSMENLPIPENILEKHPLVIASYVNIEPGFSSTASNTEKEDSSFPFGYKLIGHRLPEDHLSVTWQWIDMRFSAWISFKPKIG